MKQLIQELMTQAGTDTSGKWMSVDNAEKFADLIVRECATVAAEHDALDIYAEIREHFGVGS